MNIKKKEKLLANPVVAKRTELIAAAMATVPGFDLEDEGMKDTPLRIASMWDELFQGYEQDGVQILEDAMFHGDHESMVTVVDIPYYSTCEHHLVTFFGTVSIAYIPRKATKGKYKGQGLITGLSKMARLVDVHARRAQVQERLGQSILEDIKEALDPEGVAVIVTGRHMCMESRGVGKWGSVTTTSHLDGLFHRDEKARSELYSVIASKRAGMPVIGG